MRIETLRIYKNCLLICLESTKVHNAYKSITANFFHDINSVKWNMDCRQSTIHIFYPCLALQSSDLVLGR